MRRLSTFVSVLALSSACVSDADKIEQVEMRKVDLNDTVLQGPGFVINGPGFVVNGPGFVVNGPGFVVNGPGFVVNGSELTLTTLALNGPGFVVNGPGFVVNGPGFVVNGTLFSASVSKDGVTYNLSGLDFVGVEFELHLTSTINGVPVNEDIVVRINDITVSEEQDDVYLYDLTYRAKNGNEWRPYCGDSNVRAVPLQNAWNVETGDRIDNPNIVTFGCTDAVLAKCALWGYRPWATTTTCTGTGKKKKCTEISLRDHHQACTRMARADFCGDGHPRTVNGTAIDLFDQLDPHIQSRFTDWPVEAEWTPEGASCVSFVRHPELGLPSCFFNDKGKALQKCKSKLDSDSLLVSAFSAEDDDNDDNGDGKCGD